MNLGNDVTLEHNSEEGAEVQRDGGGHKNAEEGGIDPVRAALDAIKA
jgi:hypothetical protein